jgi:5,10-methylenetetrahydromethanopterin reductase
MTLFGGRFGVGVSNCRGVEDLVAGVQLAEELGAEIAFIAEDIGCRDAFELCALSALRTSKIRISTGVVNPYTRSPVSLAMAAATLDEISQGRATLGLGSSSAALIERQSGIQRQKPVVTMREAAEVIRRLLGGETVSYQGNAFQIFEAKLQVKPIQDKVPIVFAAMGPLMLRLAGNLADGVLLNVGASTEYVRWAVSEVERGAKIANRDSAEVPVAAWLSAYITEDYESGLQRAREWLSTMLSIPEQGELVLEHSGIDVGMLEAIRRHVQGYPHAGDRRAAADYVPPDVAKRLALVGTKALVLKRIEEYRQAGVSIPVLGLPALRALSA